MKKVLSVFILSLALLFSGYCVAQNNAVQENIIVSDAVKIPPPTNNAQADTASSPSPVEKYTEKLSVIRAKRGPLSLDVEIADTEPARRQGLMFRNSLPDGKGMLFIFQDYQDRHFWMKNTYIPLDIIFLRDDGVISHIHRNAVPYSLDRIPSNGPALAVLEVGGGQASKLGINIGDRLLHDVFRYDSDNNEEN